MSSQGLPAEETAQLFDCSKHCETFSFQHNRPQRWYACLFPDPTDDY